MNACPTSVPEITPRLLLKDAAYGAAAYGYYELSNYLSFKDWFNGALSLELSNDHPNMCIIHRKVALILGQWVSELAACRSLCLHIEDANFSEQEFLDLLPICFDSCFKLVEEVQEFDSKVQVLNLISVLIGHVHEIIPFANKLVQFFQKLWEATLSHAPATEPRLLAYFPCLVEIMERSFDHLQVAVNIFEDYTVLGGIEFL
ncbi:unnamed protein product [Dovyalis caffra]|uniref:Importin-7/11-like TPR repeats domain-containing protein n=1 Tax=Dovyalis caffra TaxID=77055 RepID=A0AAV1S0L3_9ROSI|nr:unnamed protein product [Dovyalis caffra]